MIKRSIVCTVAMMIAIAFCTPAWAAGEPAVGGQLPDMKIAMPGSFSEKSYLGLFSFGSFRIPQIKAKVVIVEIFSMYCPYCQNEAPKVNQLYMKIKQNPALKDKIKMIGIGVGNSLYEVGLFRTRYSVPFPLFADGDYVIHKQVGEVRTPYFIGIKLNPDGSHQIFYSKLGAFESADQFLATVIKLSGLQ
ncbi:MAG: TlpA disulfide reductase family protein [Deltaproteobacteria bacterium]|nr:TlpA disulfide reductase family protein [Deltaproteobacteria bacterium]